MSFHEGDLQSGIASAIQQQKAVLCFVHDESDRSAEWESTLQQDPLRDQIDGQAVAIKLQAGSSEASFLTPICPINSTPAVLVIKNAALQANIQSETETTVSLTEKLTQLFVQTSSAPAASSTSTPPASAASSELVEQASTSALSGSSVGYIDLPSSAGQPRLPNNAYDALREFTEGLKESGRQSDKILEAQLSVLSRLPIFKDEVQRLRSRGPNEPLELSQTARDRLLLRLPAAAIKAQMKVQASPCTAETSTPPPASGRVYPSPPPQPTLEARTAPIPSPPSAVPEAPLLSEAPAQQQTEYRQMQRDREQKQREERERIKAQIKADKEERRRREQVLKQNDAAASTTSASNPTKPRGTEVRVQVRTFDGSVLRNVFKPSSTISADLRPWIDSAINPNVPYDFKLILTPQPNRKIEASEEDFPLSELGVQHSCTFVIAPVQGYVDSYSRGSNSLVGSAISGGYNLLTGTAGALFGGVSSLLGYGGQQQPSSPEPGSGPAQGRQVGGGEEGAASQQQRSMRFRTLADQRAEEAGRNQFYNGNMLNFEPNRDREREEERKKD